MDFNRLTEKSQEAIRQAQSTAQRFGNQQVDVEHLLLAMLEQEGGLAPSILLKADVPFEPLHKRLVQEIEKLPKISGGATGADQIYVTNRLSRLLASAEDQAKRLKDDYVSIEHLLLAAADDQGTAGKLLREFGLTKDRLMKALVEVRGNQRVTNQNPETTYEALEKYGRDLTQYGPQGQAGPGDRARRRDTPRDPGAVAPDQEQSGADWRAGRRKDGDCGGIGAAHRARRRSRGIEG